MKKRYIISAESAEETNPSIPPLLQNLAAHILI